MARSICIVPCTPNLSYQVRLPTMGPVKPLMKYDLKGTCNGCEQSWNLLLQLAPLLQSFAMPMCLLKCVSAIVAFVPDPTNPAKINAVAADCGCLTSFTITAFAHLIKDTLTLIIGILDCILSLLNHILVLKLQATGLLLDPDVSVQKTAQCLFGLLNVQQTSLLVKFDAIGTLISTVAFLFTFAGVAPPVISVPADGATPVVIASFEAIKVTLTALRNSIPG